MTLGTQHANLTILQFNCGCMITLCPAVVFILFYKICISEIVRYPRGSTISNMPMYNFIFFKFNVKKKKSFPSDSELQKIIMICLCNIP